jgi:hypothetical protein
MKLLLIEPFKYNGTFSRDSTLVLFQNIKDSIPLWEEYNKKFKFIILDNGANEKIGTYDSYIELMKYVVQNKPYITNFELQLPDVKGNFLATKQLLGQLKALCVNDEGVRRFLGTYRIHGVLQGNNFAELEECFNILKNDFDVDTYGVPFVLDKVFGTRLKVIEWLVYCKGVDPDDIHLLGLNWNQENVQFLKHPLVHQCRSIDTTLPIKLAINNIRLDELKDFSRQTDYFNITLNDVQFNKSVDNIVELNKIIKGVL